MPGADANPAAAPGRPWDVRRLAETDSTNRVAIDLAREGAPDRTVVVADHQTAGRGRLGRSWVAPPGASLLMSVLLRPALPASRMHLLTLATALAAADACESVAGVRAELKWPNDLVVGDRKLGGILAEAVWAGGRPDAVVVGLGLNVTWPSLDEMPPDVAGIAVALNHLTSRPVDRGAVLDAALAALDGWCGRLPDGVLGEYRSRCTTLGRRVRVDLGGGRAPVLGTAVAVTDDGHLVVEGDDRLRQEVAAGDVVHVRPRA
jgi:BirA family biotin operon repressor/biotin-[acetyl-CoA-carboxylase] ligase